MINLNDFKIPQDASSEAQVPKKDTKMTFGKKMYELHQKCIDFSKKRFGESSRITTFLEGLKTDSSSSGDDVIDTLSRIKKVRSAGDRINATLTIALIISMLLIWQWGLPMLAEADQLRNDLIEQAQVIEVEKMNNESLEKWAIDRVKLEEGIHTVYAAIPDADEKAEEVIAMLEDVARMNSMVVDAIGIRKMSESQVYYDDLIGVVDIYEYTFTLESTLPNILSFIGSLRQSLRLMDIMAMEIEENKGLYRASFLLNAYHITTEE